MNTQFKKGILEYCVLLILRNKDCYGYELVSLISDFVNISEGTIYPLLKRLKSDGLLETYLCESTDGPSRKYYHITKKGIEKHHELENQWISLKEGIHNIKSKYGGKYE